MPTSATWVNFPNKFLSICHFYVVFGPVKSLSPVWLMSWVFLPMAAKSGKLLIIWKYQWEWRSLSESLGTPRWQGDNCYCKLLLNHFFVLLSFRFSFFSFLSWSWILLVTSAFHESEDQCALVYYCQYRPLMYFSRWFDVFILSHLKARFKLKILNVTIKRLSVLANFTLLWSFEEF